LRLNIIQMQTLVDYKEYIAAVESRPGYTKPTAFALGIRRRKNGKTLDVSFPVINFDESFGTAAVLIDILNVSDFKNNFHTTTLENLSEAYSRFSAFHDDLGKHPNIETITALIDNYTTSNGYAEIDIIVYFLFDKALAVESAEEAYFKLHCLSTRKAEPHSLNLDGLFGKLNNIAWTNKGPMLPEDTTMQAIRHYGSHSPMIVSHVDKFPYMVNYHIPSGVRIAAGSQVRLGAYLGEGTTVMPSGYINFNAGTKGNTMVEGRVSAGVVVEKNSDVGGGASIMGTLSGGNKAVISIGEKSLLGANSGTGISLGFGCTIAAGVYVTAGSKVWLLNEKLEPVNIHNEVVNEGANIVKAGDLSGKNNLLFIQDTQTGKLVCRPNPKTIELNSSLHKND
jgi:2,3,4,5-tetrahydropyridine-2-carboxylate N-succinyltransferase